MNRRMQQLRLNQARQCNDEHIYFAPPDEHFS